MNKKFWEELIAYFPWYDMDVDGTENDAPNDSSIVACIRCNSNVFTERTHRLMGGISEVRRWDGLRCHDIY
jgi:hypothetical protein